MFSSSPGHLRGLVKNLRGVEQKGMHEDSQSCGNGNPLVVRCWNAADLWLPCGGCSFSPPMRWIRGNGVCVCVAITGAPRPFELAGEARRRGRTAGEEKERERGKKNWPRCHTAPRLNRLEDRCVLCREIHFVFTLAVPSDCDILVAVSLLLLDCQSPGPPALGPRFWWMALTQSSETMERNGCESRNPPLNWTFFLKAIKIHLFMIVYVKSGGFVNGFWGRKSTNSAGSITTTCGIDVQRVRVRKPDRTAHQSVCRLSGIGPEGP